MGFLRLVTPFAWSRYSKKLKAKIERPRSCGPIAPREAKERGLLCKVGRAGSIASGNMICFFWLVDPEEGILLDVRFQAFGNSALIGAGEVACGLLIGKNYNQARRIGADLIDREVRDASTRSAFPKEAKPLIQLVLEAIADAAEQCAGIPIAESYTAPPAPALIEGGEGYAGWGSLAQGEKVRLIEEVLESEVAPYIALDGGGVELIALKEGNQVHIRYQGNCTSCYSAVGATLGYIQEILRNRLDHSLVVIPDLNQ